MTLLYYRILHTVTEQGSFAKAATILNLTPSAVSHAIANMEKELGFQLFNRNKGGVTLTGYGEEIYPYVLEMLNCEERFTQVVDKLNGLETGTVRLGAFNSVCIHWLPPMLQEFRKRYPGIEVEVYEGTYDDVIYWLNAGIVEIGFLSTSCNTEFPIKPIYDDRLVCIVPKGFKTKVPGRISIKEMQKQSFVVQRESCDADIKKFINDKDLDIHRSCHVIDDQATAAMVASGFGISILPELTSRNLSDGIDVLEIDETSMRIIGVAIPNKKGLTPAAEKLQDLILEYKEKI